MAADDHRRKRLYQFDLDTLILKEMTIYGIDEGPGRWNDIISITNREQIKISPLITNKFKLKDAQTAFDVVQNRRDDVIAALITP